jgi:hypothetical protein
MHSSFAEAFTWIIRLEDCRLHHMRMIDIFLHFAHSLFFADFCLVTPSPFLYGLVCILAEADHGSDAGVGAQSTRKVHNLLNPHKTCKQTVILHTFEVICWPTKFEIFLNMMVFSTGSRTNDYAIGALHFCWTFDRVKQGGRLTSIRESLHFLHCNVILVAKQFFLYYLWSSIS